MTNLVANPVLRQASALKNKKILLVTESLGPVNGVTRATEQLLEYLAAQKIETAIAAPQTQEAGLFTWRGEIPLLRLPGYPLVYNPELRVVRPFRLSTIFRQTHQPDLIYLASPASLGFQVWWQARKKAIPLVVNFQTDLGHYARLMLPPLLRQSGGYGIDRLTGRVLRHSSVKAVLYPSTSSRDYLLKLGLPAEKLRLARRGVDSLLFDPARRSAALRQKYAPEGQLLLLCVSRLSLEKGFDFLARAYAEICNRANRIPGFPGFRLVITGGNNNPQIEKLIRGYFEQKGLEVVFTGPLLGEALAEMYASADIFVYPSLTETFGQVIQEAMASGLPVVARAQGGPLDLVAEGKTGYLTSPPDLAGFAGRTLQLIENNAERTRLGAAAREIALTRDWQSVNARIAGVMAECLQ